jgi:hypothetical protein
VGNPSVADPNGRQYTAHSALPAALRTKRWLGEVPQPDLQLLKLPAAWPAALFFHLGYMGCWNMQCVFQPVAPSAKRASVRACCRIA